MGEDSRTKKSIKQLFLEMEDERKPVSLNAAQNWLKKNKPLGCYIDGNSVTDKNLKPVSIETPDGIPIAEFSDGINFIDMIEVSAIKAQAKWEATSACERGEILQKITAELNKNKGLFTQINQLTLQNNDFKNFVDYFDFYSEWAFLTTEDLRSWKSLGVIVLILSKNTPLSALSMVVAPALAAGCSVIVKPSSKTPFNAVLLSQICTDVGVPDGALNVLIGSKVAAQQMLKKSVSKVFVFGNSKIAKTIKQENPEKQFSFFTTGHTSAIVLDTSDIDSVVDRIFTETWGTEYYNNCAIHTVVVQESIYEKFLNKLTDLMYNYKDYQHLTKFKDVALLEAVEQFKKIALKSKAKMIQTPGHSNKIWTPLVVTDLQEQECEVDAPVLTVLQCRTAKEGVMLLNNLSYGLATSIWTDVTEQGLEIASSLDAGTVWINCHGLQSVKIPANGWKLSGDVFSGGKEGLIQCMLRNSDCDKSGVTDKVSDIETSAEVNQHLTSQLAAKSYETFRKWSKEESPKSYLLEIYKLLSKENEYLPYVNILKFWAFYCNKLLISSFGNRLKDVYVNYWKEAVGVIVLVFIGKNAVIKNFVTLVSSAIALGNTVIVVTDEHNGPVLQPIVKHYISSLPSCVFFHVNGLKVVRKLAMDHNVNALWLSSDSTISAKDLQELQTLACGNLKPVWITPSIVPNCRNLLMLKGLKTKAIWTPKQHSFP